MRSVLGAISKGLRLYVEAPIRSVDPHSNLSQVWAAAQLWGSGIIIPHKNSLDLKPQAPIRSVRCRPNLAQPHEVITANIIKRTLRDLYRNGDVTAFSAGS